MNRKVTCQVCGEVDEEGVCVTLHEMADIKGKKLELCRLHASRVLFQLCLDLPSLLPGKVNEFLERAKNSWL